MIETLQNEENRMNPHDYKNDRSITAIKYCPQYLRWFRKNVLGHDASINWIGTFQLWFRVVTTTQS